MSKQAEFAGLSAEEQVASLNDVVAELLAQYGLHEATSESINHGYNSTFKITSPAGDRFALRININSHRSAANIAAEIHWVSAIESVRTPKPQPSLTGEFATSAWHEASGRRLNAVLYSWLDGEELGDEPTEEKLRAAGAAMARLHAESPSLILPTGAELPSLADVFWGGADHLTGPTSQLEQSERATVARAIELIQQTLLELTDQAELRPIHADMHAWNLMWHDGEIAVFDFDDSGIGLPVQDLAVALYYLDTPEQDQALLDGYASVSPRPPYSENQMRHLILQRRIFLLNSLYESSTPAFVALIPEYKAETLRRIEALFG